MSADRGRTSFNAYTGSGETPGDFAARRVNRRQAGQADGRGRRRLPVLLAVLLLCSGAAGWRYQGELASAASAFSQWSLNLPAVEGSVINRRIQTVRIESSLRWISERQVRSVLAQFMDEGFFSLDVRALKRALEQQPWIQQVSVRRLWPDTLELDISEQRAIARWGTSALISDSGEIFEPPRIERHDSLPRLQGPLGSQQRVMSQYQSFSQILAPSGLRINDLTLDERDNWRLTLASGTVVRLGRDALVERLQRFLTVYRRELEGELETVAGIDLRYDNGVAVSRNDNHSEEVATR